MSIYFIFSTLIFVLSYIIYNIIVVDKLKKRIVYLEKKVILLDDFIKDNCIEIAYLSSDVKILKSLSSIDDSDVDLFDYDLDYDENTGIIFVCDSVEDSDYFENV